MATTIWSNKQLYHWGSGGYIKMDASYDYYRNGANMVYSVSVTVKQTGTGSWFNDKVGCQIKLDGTEVYYNATLKGTTDSSTKTWSRTATVSNSVVSNKTTGTTSLSVRVWDSQGAADFDVTNYADLVVTAAMPILTVGTPSAAMNYANFTITDSTGQTMTNYQIANSGGTVVQSGGLSSSSATIKFSNINNDRLAAGTKYENYKIRAQNSIGWGDWVTIPAFTTVNIPNASTSGDFYIGNNVTISIASANYISAWSVSASDGTSTKTGTGSGTTCTVALSDSTMVTDMLNNHPNNTNWSMTYIVHLYSDGSYVGSRTVYNTCYIPSGSYNPTFTSNNVTYDDINSTITTITGSSKKIIKGYSNVRFTVSPMTPATGASASKYKVTANGTSQEANHTGNNLQFTFNSVTTNNYSAQAIDSRNKSTTITGSYSTFIEYVAPAFTGNNTKRTEQGIGTNVNINATFSYYNWSGLSQNNIITEVKYKVGSGSWVTLTNNTDYSYLDGRLDINHTTTDGSFAQSNIYTITISVKDRLATREATITIPSSQPLLWKDRLNKWLGIKKKPTCALDVYGNANIDGNLSFQQTGTTSGNWKGVYGNVAENDQWIIRGSQTASNQGYLEIATGDDGNEPIYIRQYGISGATNPTATTPGTNCRTLTLLDSSGNTIIPGNLTINGKSFLDSIYPIGSVYFTRLRPSEFNPNNVFGGSWRRLGNGYDERFIYNLNNDHNSYENGSGGWGTSTDASDVPLQAHTHTFTTAGAGGHNHSYGFGSPYRAADGSKWWTAGNSTTGGGSAQTTTWVNDHTHTGTTDNRGSGNGSHSHAVHYIGVFGWERYA